MKYLLNMKTIAGSIGTRIQTMSSSCYRIYKGGNYKCVHRISLTSLHKRGCSFVMKENQPVQAHFLFFPGTIGISQICFTPPNPAQQKGPVAADQYDVGDVGGTHKTYGSNLRARIRQDIYLTFKTLYLANKRFRRGFNPTCSASGSQGRT